MTTDLPSGWEVAHLGDLCAPRVGKVIPAEDDSRPYLSLDNIASEVGRIDGWECAGDYRSQSVELSPGDVAYARLRPYLNKVAMADREALGSAELIVLPPPRAVTPEFVKFALEESTGDRPRLKWSQMRHYTLAVPPLAEQHRIVVAIEEHFSRLDAAAHAVCVAGMKIEASRQSNLVEALSGRLSTQNQEDEQASMLLDRIAGSNSRSKGLPSTDTLRTHERASASLWELPPGWTWAQLQDFTAAEPRAITDGPFGSNLKTAHYTTAGPRVIRLQNIGDGEFKREDAYISSEHFESLIAHSVQPDDLIVASLGESLPRACLVPHWVPPAIVKADCIRVRLHPEVNPSYVNLALQDPRLRRETAADIKGVGRPRLGLRGIRQILVPLAPRAEQDRIVEALEARFGRLDTASGVVSAVTLKFEAIRRAVLAKAFAGQLVPQNPDDEPASVMLEGIEAGAR